MPDWNKIAGGQMNKPQQALTSEQIKLQLEDPEAFYSEFPEAIQQLSVEELIQLTEEHEFDFLKFAAKRGHEGAIHALSPKAQASANDGEEQEAAEEESGDVPTKVAVEAPVKPVELPGFCWYDSKTHSKRRYYTGAKGKRGKPEWTYTKSEALLISHIDHAFLVRRICREHAYKDVSFNKPENC